MVVSADGSRVYVTHPGEKLISVVDVTVAAEAQRRSTGFPQIADNGADVADDVVCQRFVKVDPLRFPEN
jgi:hypothetical protein